MACGKKMACGGSKKKPAKKMACGGNKFACGGKKKSCKK